MRRTILSTCLALLVVGPACKKSETPTTPEPPANQVTYTAMGASDAIGVGGTVLCAPFDVSCANGTGYVPIISRRLQSDGRTVNLLVLALPGLVLNNGMLTLARTIGRDDVPGSFLERLATFVPPTTTQVTIFAGGNDTNVIAQYIRAGQAPSDLRGFIDTQVQQWGVDLVELVRLIRVRAPNVRIVALNLPNLALAPYVSSRPTLERSIMQRIAVGLSDRINALAAQNVTVVDLMCDQRLYDPANFSADGFHPNDRGYALIADLAYPAVRNGTAPAPSTTCAPRTALPAF